MYGHHKNIHDTKSFMGTFPVHINKFTNRFNCLTITNKIRNRLTNGITNDKITLVTGAGRFSKFKCFDELANVVDLTEINAFSHIIGLGRFTTEFELTNTTDLTDIKFSCIIGTNSFVNI